MIFDLLKQHAQARGDRIAVIGASRRLTYAEYFQEACLRAQALKELGVQQGDPILIGIPPSPDFHVLFCAASALGLLILPMLPSGKVPEVIRNLRPRIAVGDAEFLAQAKQRCQCVVHFVSWDSAHGLGDFGTRTPFHRPGTLDDVNTLGISSSGTTGEPKVYLRSAASIVGRANLRANFHGIHGDDVLLATRPYNSGSGINNHVLMPLYAGCSVVVHERFERFKAAEAIEKERVTVLWGVPFIFEMLASIAKSHFVDFSSLRLCVSGSASLSPSIVNKFEDRFGHFIRQRFGGSHIYPAFGFNLDGPRDAVGHKEGVFPMTVVGDDDRELGPNSIGEIVFDIERAPAMSRAQFKNKPNARGRYLYTGDMGRTDEQGHVYVVGRKSPFIKVGGNRVEPAEVESVIRSHPKVLEVVVYSIRLANLDELVGAEIVADGPLSEGELVAYCAKHMDGYKCPRQIVFTDELPRNEHGKVARSLVETNRTVQESTSR